MRLEAGPLQTQGAPSLLFYSLGLSPATNRTPSLPGEAVGTNVPVEQGGRTTLTMRDESRGARDAVLKTPMEHGVAASYDRLAELLASLGAAGMAKPARKS